jgi:hypothetical protein
MEFASVTMRGFHHMKGLLAALALGVAAANPAAQTTGTEAPPHRPAVASPKTPTVASPKPTSVRISVRDQGGATLTGVRLSVAGTTGDAEFTTGAAGTAIVPIPKAGLFRVRCEREGFVTLEREFIVGNGAWNPVDVVLNAAPPPPPAPVPPAPSQAAPAATIPPSGPPMTVSIPDFVDKNFIGRDPVKESILACKPLETVRLLQMRENIAPHVHDRIDEIIYVVAGEGAVRIGEEQSPIRAGSLVFVPNGSDHSIERRGKNPLIVVSTLVGASCDSAKSTR